MQNYCFISTSILLIYDNNLASQNRSFTEEEIENKIKLKLIDFDKVKIDFNDKNSD